MPDKLAETIASRFRELSSSRGSWESTWREIGQLVAPRRMDYARGFTLAPPTAVPGSQGQILTNRVYDPTAMFAAETLAAFLGTQLINPAETWFTLRFRNSRLNQIRANARWLREVQELMLAELNSARSSFHPSMGEVFLDLVAFGTGCLSITEGKGGRPIYIARPLSESYLADNAETEIDTYYRRFDWTYRQITQFFGGIPPALERLFKQMPPEQQLTRTLPLLHAVFPREDYDPGKSDAPNMPWASVYVSLDSPVSVLSESGYRQFPYIASRWSRTPGDVYGRSPAMTVMPDIRMLQAMSKLVLSGAQTRIKKPIMVPDDGFIGPLNLIPGGTNVYRASSKNRLEPLDLADDPGIGLEMMDQRRESVLRAFFVDVIRGVSMRGDASPLKAAEVYKRDQEALQALVPPLTRLQREALSPAIDRTFSIMYRNGGLPPAPPQIAGSEIDIDFVAPAVIAARMGEADKMQRALTQAAQMIQLDPASLQNIDADAWVRRTIELNGVPSDLLAPEGTAQASREQQAAQLQQQAVIAQGADLAKVAGALK